MAWIGCLLFGSATANAYWIVSGLDGVEADGIPDTIIVKFEAYADSPLRAIGEAQPWISSGFDWRGVANPGNYSTDIGTTYRLLRDLSSLALPFVGSIDLIEFTVNPTVAGLRVLYAGYVEMDMSPDSFPINLSPNYYGIQFTVAEAPPASAAVGEPATITLGGLALLGLSATARRRRTMRSTG